MIPLFNSCFFIVSIHSDQSVVLLRVMTLIMYHIDNKGNKINYNEISTQMITN